MSALYCGPTLRRPPRSRVPGAHSVLVGSPVSAPRRSGFDRVNPRADVLSRLLLPRRHAWPIMSFLPVHSPLGMDDRAVPSRDSGWPLLDSETGQNARRCCGLAAPVLPTTQRTVGSLVPLPVEL